MIDRVTIRVVLFWKEARNTNQDVVISHFNGRKRASKRVGGKLSTQRLQRYIIRSENSTRSLDGHAHHVDQFLRHETIRKLRGAAALRQLGRVERHGRRQFPIRARSARERIFHIPGGAYEEGSFHPTCRGEEAVVAVGSAAWNTTSFTILCE